MIKTLTSTLNIEQDNVPRRLCCFMIKMIKYKNTERISLTGIWPQFTHPVQAEPLKPPPRIPVVIPVTGQTRDRCSQN